MTGINMGEPHVDFASREAGNMPDAKLKGTSW
jgi:hypothetical protein